MPAAGWDFGDGGGGFGPVVDHTLRVRLSAAPMDVEDGSDVLVVWDVGDGGHAHRP
jgi:hypothetical protein